MPEIEGLSTQLAFRKERLIFVNLRYFYLPNDTVSTVGDHLVHGVENELVKV